MGYRPYHGRERSTGGSAQLFLLLMVLLGAATCRSVQGTVEEQPTTKGKAVDLEEDKVDDEEQGGSWANWAKEKISEGLRLKQDEVKEEAKKAGDAAGRTKDKIGEAASDAGQLGAEKAGSIKESGEQAGEKAQGVISEKAREARDTGTEKAAKAKDAATENLEAAKEKLASGYDSAKQKTFQEVKDHVSGGTPREDEL